MDPTKTMSYRRWRNRPTGKGFFGLEPIADESYKRTPLRPAKAPWGRITTGGDQPENV